MKKCILTLVLVLSAVLAHAQRPVTPSEENLWPGFGAGSLHQGDSLSARRFKAADITGLSLMGVGAVGIVVTAVERDILKAMVGETTKADYYICGGILIAGAATLVTSRILAVRKARDYELSPVAYPSGGGGLSLTWRF